MLNTTLMLLSCVWLVLVGGASSRDVVTAMELTTKVEVESVTETYVAQILTGGITTFVSTGFSTRTQLQTDVFLHTESTSVSTVTVTPSQSFVQTSSPTITPGTTSSLPTSIPAMPNNLNESSTNITRSKSNAGLIAGIVISALCALIGIFIAVVSLNKRRRAVRQINQMNSSWPAPFFSNRAVQDTENPVQEPTARISEKAASRGASGPESVDAEIAKGSSDVPANTALMIQEIVARTLRRELAGMRESMADKSRPPTYYNGSGRGV